MHGLYVVFFMAITVFSTFFVSAILLTLFMDTYSGSAKSNLTPAQRRKWACLTLVHILWSRTLCSPNDAHTGKQEIKLQGNVKAILKTMDQNQDGRVVREEFLAVGGRASDWNRLDADGNGILTEEELQADEELTPLSFEQLMLQSHHFGDTIDPWIQISQELVVQTICLLAHADHQESCQGYRHEVTALATVCCKLQLEAEYQTVVRGYFPKLAVTDLESLVGDRSICSQVEKEFLRAREQVVDTRGETHDCFRANQELVLVRMLVKTGLCADILDEQLSYVRSVLGEMSNTEAHKYLYNTSVPLLTVDESDSNTCTHTVLATALRITALQCNRPELSIPVEDGSSSGNKYVQRVLMACDMLQLVNEMYQIDIASDDPVTQNVSALISLIHTQTWRLRILFDSLDINQDGSLQLVEFEKLWCFTTVSARLAASELLQKEAEQMLLVKEIELQEQELAGIYLNLHSHSKAEF